MNKKCRKPYRCLCVSVLCVLAFASCAGHAKLPFIAGVGPHPVLPPPDKTLIPTVNIAPAVGWPAGAMPTPAAGFAVNAFASGLNHPRWLYVLPNGDVLVAETNAPPKPSDVDRKGLKGLVMKVVQKRAGAGVASPDRITLLRDANHDGIAEVRTVLLPDLHSPFGMALVDDGSGGGTLYIADADALLRVPYRSGETRITATPSKLTDLPGGPINHHWTKNVVANRDGSRLYVSVGSNSNILENGLQAETNRADILEIDPANGHMRIFASGLRNPVGMAWQPQSGVLWTVVNERDELGSDLVPDYLTSVHEGAFYGWPYSYFGQHIDQRAQPQRPDLVAKAIAPDYALGTHVAPLGLAFYPSADKMLSFPDRYHGGAFVGEHGSWNRRPRSGYAVVFVPFANGKPNGLPEDVLTGFVDARGDAYGRPVGVAIDAAGALLVADDVGNRVWRVTPSPPSR
jgi:glucose/arabinose dehydrogenase